jgi:hypothetical protein
MDKIRDSGRWVEDRELYKLAVRAGWVVVAVRAGWVVVVVRAELVAAVVVVGLDRILHIKYV